LVNERASEALAYEANAWLMATMRRECRRASVTAVHSYEECSAWQFAEAKRIGKACVYDLPIGHYAAWEETREKLARRYRDWLPRDSSASNRDHRATQKRQELDLADIVLVPSRFARDTVLRFADKQVRLVPYGVDLDFWSPGPRPSVNHTLTICYAGHCSVRKGTPVLLEAWRAAALPDAELQLVGPWHLSEQKRQELPASVRFAGPLSSDALRTRYRAADAFVFPSLFEGFGLVILEALACGVPVVATDATAGPDVLDDTCGRVIEAGNVDALVEALRWLDAHRDDLAAMKSAARRQAQRCSWETYRSCVSDAVADVA
jgi:glycosyltransferase involved in cell wall biosynthesis